MQEWNTFHTRPQDIPLRKWQGRESPGDEVESWLRVESSFFFFPFIMLFKQSSENYLLQHTD